MLECKRAFLALLQCLICHPSCRDRIIASSLVSLTIALIGFPGLVVAAFLIDSVGRKRLQIGIFSFRLFSLQIILFFFPLLFFCCCCYYFVLFCFILLFLSFIITAGFGLSFICLVLLSVGFQYFPPALFIVIYGLLFFFCNLGPGSTVYVLSTEIFPERMSSASLGCVVWRWLAFGLVWGWTGEKDNLKFACLCLFVCFCVCESIYGVLYDFFPSLFIVCFILSFSYSFMRLTFVSLFFTHLSKFVFLSI